MATPRRSQPDTLVVGQLFLDVVFAGLRGSPRPGEEEWTADFGWGPGGIANMAMVSARLGASAAISAVVGDDPLSVLCTERLEHEGVDISGLRTMAGWSLPVTASLGFDGDRALVTGGTPAPRELAEILDPDIRPRVAIVHVDDTTHDVVRPLADRGAKVFADLGWDGTGAWDTTVLDGLDGCYAFVPNDAEAMAFTRTETPEQALEALSSRVPLSVVTLGARGVLALDAATGERVRVEPVPVDAVDVTGAGDVFVAALAVATLRDWTLRERVDFAALAAAVTVSRPGGASTAPTRADLVRWLDQHPDTARASRFAFLRDPYR
ncbi:carbohydrate kinase family protein [Isoptericola croceus]|uniref:carbohydrate kinase family protein n=1 Tax=Isoptericola croceus TaxID=3031406 RepID=UPI0023FA1681|nr:PfkB family carbohydrate kinase [Isoptericola croceus]